MDAIGSSTLTQILTPTALTTANVAALTGTDIQALKGQGAAILMALKTGGSGNYSCAVKLQHASDGDIVTSVTPGSNTGNGTCTQVYGGPDTVAENITVTFSNATTASVVGDVSGALGSATVGTLFSCKQIEFMLTAGSDAFVNNDTFVIVTTARTYADVDGGSFASLTTASTAALTAAQIKPLDFDKIGRYMKPVVTLGGTSPAYTVGVVAQSD